MHKYGTCNTKGKVSVREVIDHICVMTSCEPSTVCNDRKCDESRVIAHNMLEPKVM